VIVWNWMKLQTYVLLLYPLFSTFTNNQLSNTRLPWQLWAGVYVAYIMYLIYFPLAALSENGLPIASVILAAEQVNNKNIIK